MDQNSQFSLIAQLLENRATPSGPEEKLRKWAKPPSDSEIEKCDRAIRMVKQAIDQDPKLSKMDLTVFGKGSYANRTNIPSDSDVDVGVTHNGIFFNDYPAGTSMSDFGFVAADYSYAQFKQDIAQAIINKFGASSVTVGSKAITVHSNTARVDADVVPHFGHKRFAKDGSFVQGVALKDSSGRIIHNWPDQDYDNGVTKNDRTKTRYKSLTRILKNLRGEMEEKGVKSANGIASYLLACLVWNIPDYVFDEESYIKMVAAALDYLQTQTANLEMVKNWGEVNDLKYLFRSSQGWTLQQTHDFLKDARAYLRKLTG